MINLVLIGMPGSGKSLLGSLISSKLNRTFIDIDAFIEKRENKKITDIFEEYGEKAFRDLEALAILEVSKENNLVISTGGGSILREDNMNNLKNNGKVIFINRPLDNIISDLDISSRPLFQGKKDNLYNLYENRIHLYKKYSDYEVLNNTEISLVVERILEWFQD